MPPSSLSASLTRTALRRLARPSFQQCLIRSATTRAISSTTRPTPPTRLQPRPSTAPSKRPFHSTQHPGPPGPFSDPEISLLSAAYAHVRTHGFMPSSLALGARDLGLLDISANLLPRGEYDLIMFHCLTQREALAAVARDLPARLTAREKVFELTWARLRGNEAVLGRWQDAIAIMGQPSYIPSSVKAIEELMDEILHLAGDLSVDSSWYTKRIGLSAIYVSAELFQTEDRSVGFVDTKAFLRRRFDEAKGLDAVVGAVGEYLGGSGKALLNVLRSKGVPV